MKIPMRQPDAVTEEVQTIQWTKYKLLSTKHEAERNTLSNTNPTNNRSEIWCSGSASSSCSTYDTSLKLRNPFGMLNYFEVNKKNLSIRNKSKYLCDCEFAS